MTINERRINDLVFAEFFKEFVDDVTDFPVGFVMNAMFVRNLASFFNSHFLPEINAGIFLDQVNHMRALERLVKVDFRSLIRHDAVVGNDLCGSFEDAFGFIHDVLEVKISSICFEHGKFRVVMRIDAFITENASDFINAFHSADDQAFQMQFKSDAQIKLNIERIVVSDERTSRSTAGLRMQDGRFNFKEAVFVKIATNCRHDATAINETIVAFAIRNQIKIALTINLFNVLQTMIFVRKRTQRLRKESKLCCLYGQFAHVSLDDLTCNSQEIAEIRALKDMVHVFSDFIFADIKLHSAGFILKICKTDFSFAAFGNHAPCNRYDNVFVVQFFLVHVAILLMKFLVHGITFKTMAEWINACVAQFLHLFATNAHLIVHGLFISHY